MARRIARSALRSLGLLAITVSGCTSSEADKESGGLLMSTGLGVSLSTTTTEGMDDTIGDDGSTAGTMNGDSAGDGDGDGDGDSKGDGSATTTG
ncbi:MAG: hypothetical protein ACPHRO_06355, partial [Nannocystaceae bacterium]